jgi:hypothetical protein
MTELGFTRFVVDRLLNHTEPGVGSVYDRYEYLREKRQALEVWAAHLREIVVDHHAGCPAEDSITNPPTAPTHAEAGLTIEADGEPAPSRERNEAKRQRLADAMRQQRPKRWITAFEVADEALREPGSIASKRESRPLIYVELARAIAQGSFEENGRTHVHWLSGSGGRMTRSRLVTLALGYSPDGTDAGVFEKPAFLKAVVAELVFPVAVVRRWLRDRGRFEPLPPEFEADDEGGAVDPASKAEPALPQATDGYIRAALRAVYNEAQAKGDKAPNVKQVGPLAKAWLVKKGRTASKNKIGKIADEDEFRRYRRPVGKTIKSEGHPAEG